MKAYRHPTVLTIAGFDGSGGAGIQADIKTISALGCYATSVLTALPIQNTKGVQHIFPIPSDTVAQQLNCILQDIIPDAIKIGMLHTVAHVAVVAELLKPYKSIPIIFDPVMVSSSGQHLLEPDTIVAIVKELLPIVEIITPNMDEAAVLAQHEVSSIADMKQAALRIKALGGRNVLVKGGHQDTAVLTSLLLDEEQVFHAFDSEKIDTQNTHGTGCTLSSAIASFRAQSRSIAEAVGLGQRFVHAAIGAAADVRIGKGKGPLNHFFDPQKLLKI